MGLVLADQFGVDSGTRLRSRRECAGAVAPLEVARRAFAALPSTVQEYYYRGDSACHESKLVNWLRDEKRQEGRRGGSALPSVRG
jgi:hypothetical protein